MRIHCILTAALALAAGAHPVVAQKDQPAPGDRKPILRLEAGGPTSTVTALAFSPDGHTLYAAGFDKVVRVWTLDDKTGRFELQGDTYFRVPIGPGLRGAVNALAVSPDGKLLAVGGLGVVRGGSGFDDIGVVVPSVGAMTADMRQDEGLIYVFDAAKREMHRTLRGHTGPVRALAFAPAHKGKPPLLVSTARGRDEKDTQYVGEVRAWNADTGEAVGALTGLPDPQPHPRPGLAVWHTGDNATDLRVALALDDDRLRVWNVARGGAPAKADDGFFNSTAALLPDGRLLTGSLPKVADRRNGRLQAWDVTGEKPAKVAAGMDLEPTPAGVFGLPRALTLLASRGDGTLDTAAVVEARLEQGKAVMQRTYSLELRSVGADFGARRARVPLWGDSDILPTIAAAPGGKHVAVSGSTDHRILVFKVAELLAGKAEVQAIQSAGTSFRGVQFGQRGQDKKRETGLILDEAAGGKIVFNFSDSSITKGDKGWTPEAPNPGGWLVRREDEKGLARLMVAQGNNPAKTVTVRAPQRLLAHALVPAPAGLKAPLLAAAVFDDETGESFVELYDGATGEHVARFAGHLAAVRSLAVSADSRLLASAADDQTVCLWGLADADKIVGEVGGLRGLSVALDAQGRLVVERVDPANAATKALPQGAIIEGLVEGKDLKPFDSPRAFYEAVWSRPPGTVLTFRVRRGNAVEDVQVRLGQGTQERKPLLTLFIAGAAQGGQRDWLGWHPTGPFDSSGPQAERYAGWHFNTGKPAAPTEFAPVEQYRKNNYKKDILKHLVAFVNLEKALEATKPPPQRPLPRLKLEVVSDGKEVRPDDRGQHLVKARKLELRLTADQNFRPAEGDAFVWKINGAQARPLGGGEFNRWTAEVELPDGAGGMHEIQAEARLADYPGAPERSPKLTVRYQPPAPRLEYSGPKQLTVTDPAFAFRAGVRPGLEGVAAEVTLTHLQGGKEVNKVSKTYKGADELVADLKLGAGENQVTLQARNAAAPAEFAALERDELSVTVVLEKKPDPVMKKVAKPEIEFKEIFAKPEGAAERPLALAEGRPVLVDVPRVRIKGTIKATEPLTVADLVHGADRDKLTGFSKDKKSCAIDATVTLGPGEQLIYFQARTADSEVASVGVKVFYRPKLPEVKLEPPVPGLIFFETEDRDTREIALEGKLHWPAKDRSLTTYPLRAEVAVNGTLLKDAAVVEGDTLKAAKVPLQPGQNHLEVRLSHQYGGEPAVAYVYVRYLRPPRDIAWGEPKVGAKPVADLTARVWSPLPLQTERAVVHVNGEPLRQPSVKAATDKSDPKGRTWLVTLSGVPLRAGKNEVKLWVRNAEAEVREPGALVVAYEKPAPKPPAIVILSPADGARKLIDPEVKVRFRVQSETKLAKVELWRGDKQVQVEKAGEEYTASAPLEWGLNELNVEAANEGGVQREKMTLNVVREPLKIEVRRLEVLDRDGNPAGESKADPDTGRLGGVKQPMAWVHGTVRWSSASDPQLDEDSQVRVYVNGFQQPPVALGKRAKGATERQFKAAVVLNETANKVEVNLGDARRHTFTVDCASPGLSPELHVVVIAPREADPAQVRKGMTQALAGIEKGKKWTVRTYPVLTEDNERSDVFSQLLEIQNKKIKPRARDGFATNDAVLVYYHGTETFDKRGGYLWMAGTRGERDLADTAVDMGLLQREFANFLGAQVLMLDVTPTGAKGPDDRPSEARFAVLRHMWTGGQDGAKTPRLLTALGEAMPKAGNLSELSERLGKQLGGATSADKLSRFDSYLPAALDLRFRP